MRIWGNRYPVDEIPLYVFDTPLLGSAILMLIIAIKPFIILVNAAENEDKDGP